MLSCCMIESSLKFTLEVLCNMLLFMITSEKEVMFSSAFLFVCQEISKGNGQMFMKFCKAELIRF